MNSFPRYSHFQNHLITAVPNRYACAECHSILIYACGDENETVTCAKDPKHMGLVNKKDVIVPVEELDIYQLTRNADPVLAEFLRAKREPMKNSLFGDNYD